MAATTYKLRLETDELEKWKRAAEGAGLKLAEWVRRRCEGEDRNAGGEAAEARIAPDPKRGERVRETIKQLEAAEPTQNFSLVQLDVSRRTGHAPGCDCFHCLQTLRFLAPPSPKKDDKKPAKKSRR